MASFGFKRHLDRLREDAHWDEKKLQAFEKYCRDNDLVIVPKIGREMLENPAAIQRKFEKSYDHNGT